MNNDYSLKLIKQTDNARLLSQKTYLNFLYSHITRIVQFNDKVLEIGSGAGISKYFLRDLNILRTDFLNWPKNFEIIGNIDAENLPYSNNSYDLVFGVDMLHHLNNPHKALEESIRVTKKGGKLIFIEPYVSIFSYPVYKIFHEENTTFKYKFKEHGINSNPAEGDQGVAKAIFVNKNIPKLLSHYKKIDFIKLTYISPLSFFITGGLTKPINTGEKLLKILIKIEDKIPQSLLKYLAARLIIEISIKSD